jgi:ABC-type lipoprotein release transport system permease subunit
VLLKLAWRNIWRRKRRTAITASSIALGVALCLFFTGLSDGMYGQLTEMAVKMGSGHLVIEDPAYRDDPGLDHTVVASDELIRRIATIPQVAGYSERVAGPAIVSSSYGTVGGSFDAVDPSRDRDISLLAKNTVEGRYLEGPGEMIVGVELARKLKTKIGGKVVLTSQDRDGETVQDLFRVVGVFETRSALIDGFYVQITIDQARQMLGMADGEVTALGLYLDDASTMDEVTAALDASSELAAASAVVVPWQVVLKDLADYIKVDNAFNYIFQFLLFLVILAGVLNTVLMSVMERTYEFGVMLSIGMRRSRLVALVMVECTVLGALGTLCGAALGWLENLILFHHPISFASQVSELSVGGFFIEPSLMMDLSPTHFAVTLVAVFLMILIAGFYPAVKAGMVEPVEALHSL